MAGGAIARQPQPRVAGVGAVVKIGQMAGLTLRWRSLVTIGMAQDAIRNHVPPCQRKIRIVVVKAVARTAARMACEAGRILINITTHSRVLLIHFGIDVAGDAHELGIIRGVIVAIGTLRPLAAMLAAVNREKSVMLSIFSGHPPYVCGVAFRTTGYKTCALMIGVKSIFVIRLMAGKAIGWRSGKISRTVASGTVPDVMPFFQGEEPVVDAFGRPVESILTVAFHTIGGKARPLMVGMGSGKVIVQVAVHALITDPVEFQGRCRHVALITVQCSVNAEQGKAVVVMQAGDIIHQPVIRRMASGTIRPNGGPVHIRMAGNALGVRLRKNESLVALPAIHPGMLSRQRESGGRVVEREGIGINGPTERRVAVGTADLKISAMRGLRIEARRQPQKQD